MLLSSILRTIERDPDTNRAQTLSVPLVHLNHSKDDLPVCSYHKSLLKMNSNSEAILRRETPYPYSTEQQSADMCILDTSFLGQECDVCILADMRDASLILSLEQLIWGAVLQSDRSLDGLMVEQLAQ